MPRPAMCSGLYLKCNSVFSEASATSHTSPPRPPSPPDGPPRGTNFSRRNAVTPLPPLPPCTRIFARSINIKIEKRRLPLLKHRQASHHLSSSYLCCGGRGSSGGRFRIDADELS